MQNWVEEEEQFPLPFIKYYMPTVSQITKVNDEQKFLTINIIIGN